MFWDYVEYCVLWSISESTLLIIKKLCIITLCLKIRHKYRGNTSFFFHDNRRKVKRRAVMRKGLVCPVLCKFTGSSGLNPQSEVRKPDTHLFSLAFIYSLFFFDSAVSLSISISLTPGSFFFFYSDSSMNNSKWLGKFTWRLNYHLCFSSGVFSA